MACEHRIQESAEMGLRQSYLCSTESRYNTTRFRISLKVAEEERGTELLFFFFYFPEFSFQSPSNILRLVMKALYRKLISIQIGSNQRHSSTAQTYVQVHSDERVIHFN